MRKFLLGLILVLLCFTSAAEPLIGSHNIHIESQVIIPTITYTEFSKESYFSMNDAAVHAIAVSYSMSNRVEFGGIIYLNPDGSYGYTIPKTDKIEDAVWIDHITRPPGTRMVANYHTHPCMPYTHFPKFFSPNDIFLSFYYDIPAFMGDFCSGKVHKFDPMVDFPANVEVPGVRLTSGRDVGKIGLVKTPIIVEPKPKGDRVPDEIVEDALDQR